MSKKATFNVGQVYSMASAIFPDYLYRYKVTARTARRVGLVEVGNSLSSGETFYRMISMSGGVEVMYPRGLYDGCPVLRADNLEQEQNDGKS